MLLYVNVNGNSAKTRGPPNSAKQAALSVMDCVGNNERPVMSKSQVNKEAVAALWRPSAARIEESQMEHFRRSIELRYGVDLPDYTSLHQWSIEHPSLFWGEVWRDAGIVASSDHQDVLTGGDRFDTARWFPTARLNFAENLLRYRDDQIALVGLGEAAERRTWTYQQLHDDVSALAAALRDRGVVTGDVVAGYMPNVPETVIAMLATASIGAIWTSCSPDFGFNGASDRFGQVAPKVLFSADGYCYNGKRVGYLDRAAELVATIDSIEHWIVVRFLQIEPAPEHAECFTALLSTYANRTLVFEPLPFDHPLYIMYSSGTTGKPKCIVHGAGGTLLQHVKEHRLHTDLRRDDVFFYFTTCGWMMWNWLISGLATGCTLVLYDGSPFANDGEVLLDALESENISVFGVGAKYLDALEKAGKTPGASRDLSALRTLLSTGSPLSKHSFEWVYHAFKPDVCLSSISGGTDIISCFVLGNPTLPVYAGEIQCVGLGMAVAFWSDAGEPLRSEKGELVCTAPFPSAPIGFWNDRDGSRYRSAYFDRFDNVWAHGDFGELTERHTVIIHGRSDAVLNPGGVRIGTAEIYRQVETVPEVLDSVVIGQRWGDDERVVLFVVLRGGHRLDAALEQRLRDTIRTHTTPRHVPAIILGVADIPRTISGKVSELAVKRMVHGEPVHNTDALANPEALAAFSGILEPYQSA